MSEEAIPQAAVTPASADTSADTSAASPIITASEVTNVAGAVSNGVTVPGEAAKEVATPDALAESKDQVNTNDKQPISDITQDKPATTQGDLEMKGDLKTGDAAQATEEPAELTIDTPTAGDKSKARRKSVGIPEHKNKKITKKASKAKMNHIDAQPGDYFMVRLKGYPLWPAIVCDESMLPVTLLKSRPVTAARADGTYREDYQDGGPRAKDRTFPIMYLYTNEFGWIPNYDLVDIDLDTIGDVSPNMRKDLYAAHQLAAEKHDLQYFKGVLEDFMNARLADIEAKEAAKAAKKASKSKRKSAKTADDNPDDEDVEMVDADADADAVADSEEAPSTEKKSKSKKRKADEDTNTPQRTDSVKKPRPTIKLNTPKTTNGTGTPKTGKGQATLKSTKPKAKKAAVEVKESPEVVAPPEPELTPEAKFEKKKKDIMFFRHRLQRGLLDRNSEPKEEDMKDMADHFTALENYEGLDVSLIRATKINKVLKAILKLTSIPKEDEFQLKPRSQTLLDNWNKILASEEATPVEASTTNGLGSESKDEPAKKSPVEATNGVKDVSKEVKAKEPAVETTAKETKTKEIPLVEDAPPTDDASKDSIAGVATAESTA